MKDSLDTNALKKKQNKTQNKHKGMTGHDFNIFVLNSDVRLVIEIINTCKMAVKVLIYINTSTCLKQYLRYPIGSSETKQPSTHKIF